LYSTVKARPKFPPKVKFLEKLIGEDARRVRFKARPMDRPRHEHTAMAEVTTWIASGKR